MVVTAGDRIDEERLRLALDIARIGFWERDLRTNKILRSPIVDEIFGFEPGEVGDDAAPFLACVHPEDWDSKQPLIDLAIERDVPVTHEFRIMRRDGSVRWVWSRAEIRKDPDGTPARLISILQDVTERHHEQRERERLLRELFAERALLTAVVEHVPVGVMVAEAPSARLIVGNTQAQRIWRCDALIVDPAERYRAIKGFHPDGRRHEADDWPLMRSLRTGAMVLNEEIVFERGDGSRGIMSASSAPIREPDGRIVAGVVAFTDITDRKEAEQRLRLLAAEVDHRAKNALAVAQGLVRLTRADTVEEFARAVTGRINALARAHMLLSQNRWNGADVRRLVEEELAAYVGDKGRAAITGPSVSLAPTAAQPFSMAIHELATNAIKYGALSVPEGRVRVGWSWTPKGQLAVRWTETGGPSVRPPCGRGFGSEVIDRVIHDQLDAEIQYEWRAEGLTCEIVVPARRFVCQQPVA